MTDDTLPDPPVPADCDLKDFAFMPLDVARLRDSDLASDETPEACWAAVLLWCASWHQVPAASIPDSEQWQAKHAGYVSRGRIDAGWQDVRAGALRGWVKCSDGRLYHRVVAEKARDAWRSKLEQRWKTECARIKKHCQRHDIRFDPPSFEAWLADGCPQGHPLPVPRDAAPAEQGQPVGVPGDMGSPSLGTDHLCPDNVPRETHSKGQGQGQGQKEIRERDTPPAAAPEERAGAREAEGGGLPEKATANTSPAPDASPAAVDADPEPTPPRIDPDVPRSLPTLAPPSSAYDCPPDKLAAVCAALKRAGIPTPPAGNVTFRSLIAQGATPDEFAAVAREALDRKVRDPMAWTLVVLPRKRAEAGSVILPPGAPPPHDTGKAAAESTQAYLDSQKMTPEQRAASQEARRAAMAKLGRPVKAAHG